MAFNSMSHRLADTDRLRQQMTTDVAHELRTPVTVLRGHLEAMMDGVYPLDAEHLAVAYDQTIQLARLVEDLRLLTQAESGRLALDFTRPIRRRSSRQRRRVSPRWHKTPKLRSNTKPPPICPPSRLTPAACDKCSTTC